MPCQESPYLSQYEPIIEGLLTLSWSDCGWHLAIRHRHCTGRLGDCGSENFGPLAPDELEDVLEAVLSTWGPLGGTAVPRWI